MYGHSLRVHTMSLNYTIDTEQQLITITGEYADAEEWAELLARILSDPRRAPGFSVLRDLRDATTPTDAATVVRAMTVVRRFWPHIQPSRAAILTCDDIDLSALVASALADAHGLPLRTFRSVDAAMQWLKADSVLGV
jgi:hypothetical protein